MKFKTTNTGLYLNKKSFSPAPYKCAAMRSLIYRCYKISYTDEIFEETYKTIRAIFINNGFHFKFIDRLKDKIINKILTPEQNQESNKIFYWKLPYVQNIEKETQNVVRYINKELKQVGTIRVAYSTLKSQHYFPNKDKIPDGLRSNVVYQYKCDQCPGHTYTGETTRHFDTRKWEHKIGKPVPSEITLHPHTYKDDNFKIVLQTEYTKIGESIVNNTVSEEKRLNLYSTFKLKLFSERPPSHDRTAN
jgi:hypothetical protein